jgi:CRP/FNR family cyclic AMP-dependent transcriptional regulator
MLPGHMDTVRTLLRTYLFQDLSPAELEPLARIARTKHIVAGGYAFRSGEAAEDLFIVAEGQIKEYILDSDGNEYVTELMGPGAVFGEPGIFARPPTRVVDELALEPTTLLTIAREPLFRFLITHHPAMLRLLEGLSTEARQAAQITAMFAFSQLSSRLVTKLLQLSETRQPASANSNEVELALSQSTLAGMVGATREKVNRALAPLVGAGLVRLEYRRIVLTNVTDLRRLATSDVLKPHPRHHHPGG